MSLDMQGHIDPVFESAKIQRIVKTGGEYVDGIWVEGTESRNPHTVNIQPSTPRELQILEQGGERIIDGRNFYLNDGIDASIQPSDVWEFRGQLWKCHMLDNRPWRNYCKVTVGRIDDK